MTPYRREHDGLRLRESKTESSNVPLTAPRTAFKALLALVFRRAETRDAFEPALESETRRREKIGIVVPRGERDGGKRNNGRWLCVCVCLCVVRVCNALWVFRVVGTEEKRRRGSGWEGICCWVARGDPANIWVDGRKVRWVFGWGGDMLVWRQCELPVWGGSGGGGLEKEATVGWMADSG